MQTVDVVEGHVGDLERAKRWKHSGADQGAVFLCRPWALPGEVFLLVSATEIGNGWSIAPSLDFSEGIATKVNRSPQPSSLFSGDLHRPIRKGTDGEPTLSPYAGPIIKYEALSARRRRTDAKALDLTVIGDPVTAGWQVAPLAKLLYEGVS
jgi:hypothetical protein